MKTITNTFFLLCILLLSLQCSSRPNSKNKYSSFKNSWSGSGESKVWHFHAMGLCDKNSPMIDDKKITCKNSLLYNAAKSLHKKFNKTKKNIQLQKLKKAIKIINIDYDNDYNCEAILEINKKDI